MLALYDQIRRLGRTVDDFERNFCDELEREQDTDRGAAQTAAADAVSRRHVSRLRSSGSRHAGCGDEHALRARACRERRHGASAAPRRRHGRRSPGGSGRALAGGLRSADATPRPGGSSISCAPRRCWLLGISSGCTPRCQISTRTCARATCARASDRSSRGRAANASSARSAVPCYRDREEELIGRCAPAQERARRAARLPRSIAPRSSSGGRCRISISRATCSRTPAIPFEALDTLPLAAEPYAAASISCSTRSPRLHARRHCWRCCDRRISARRRRRRRGSGR